MDHLMNTYKRLDIAFERGEGVWLWDTEGKQYLDAFSGIAVCGLGHANPAVTKAIQEQAAKVIHTSNLFQITQQTELANILARLSGLDQVFFCNSGAEAIEAALKLIRLYGHQQGIEFPKVIVMESAFHGRTLATIAAGGNAKVQAGFEPLMPGFIRAPYNNIEALQALAKSHKDIAAILVEPIQGEGGILVPSDDYLNKLREICDQNKWLLAVDEVQSGMGRTGNLFSYQANAILPDIMSLAKGLANGVPIGACLATEKVASLFKPGNHGSTFGGNPLACAAGIATINEIEKLKLWENAKAQGTLLLTGLKEKLKDNPHVKAIRGKGLLIGIELDKPCRDILPLALKEGLLFNITRETVIRLAPPLIITREQVEKILAILPGLIEQFTK
jgi:acetylornithine/N-succinyldiaminopimelate aminotransferase